ncbi:MAG TPA: glycosyltransferase [Vicinamibacterales bacterium]|nr:glycosyltransferase [Vicinamibacterales bacterium]
MNVRLVLVVPCYNEAARLQAQPFLRFTSSTRDAGILFVNDGSTDGTATVLADIASGGGGRIDVKALPANVGKAEAVRQGVQAALRHGPALVGYWDADLATPLAAVRDFLTILDERPSVDIVMGSRVNLLGRYVERRPMRHYVGRLFATAASVALGVAVYDTQCGAKIFRVTPAITSAFATPFRSRWTMDVELLARYLDETGRSSATDHICEVPLHEWRDMAGSKVRPIQGLRAFSDLAAIWWKRRRSY